MVGWEAFLLKVGDETSGGHGEEGQTGKQTFFHYILGVGFCLDLPSLPTTKKQQIQLWQNMK